MDGIEKIIGRINAAAAEDCAAIAQKAQQECEAIHRDYAQKVQSAYENAIKNGQREIALDAEHIIRNARLDVRKELLQTKQQILDSAFTAAKEKLRQLPEDEYIAWLAHMAAEASSGSGEIILSHKDTAIGGKILEAANQALLKKGKKAELSLSTESKEMNAGFVLREGRLEVNCSLDALLEMKRQQLAAKVAEELFR